MAQDYDVEYTVKVSDVKTYQDKKGEIEKVLLAHGFQSTPLTIDHNERDLVIVATGYQDLFYDNGNGTSAEKEHLEILKELQEIDQKVRLSTKWHYCTGWDWDFEFGDEEE